LRDFCYQLPVFSRRHERQHALDNQDQRQRRENFGSYFSPLD
jgi:hypothetical protein